MRRASAGIAAAVLLLGMVAACAGGGAQATAPASPPGYIIAEISIINPGEYEAYKTAVAPMIARFGGRYLVRAGQTQAKEGASPAGRVVVLEFESFAAAQTFYESAEYQAVIALRTRNATSRVFIVEGLAPAP
jgi:uncharacterized protein (DUF1330 family)